MHTPATHDEFESHALPHAPQLSSSVITGVQRPSHATSPIRHTVAPSSPHACSSASNAETTTPVIHDTRFMASDERIKPAAPAEANAPRDHWPSYARRWALLGPPLRPSPEDIVLAEAAVAEHMPANARALVLGTTLELIAMRWPAGTQVIAIDRSAAMIAEIARTTSAPATFVQAEWTALPIATASVAAVVGDGSATCIAYPHAYHQLADELARVLVPSGEAVLRLFAAPPQRESLTQIAADLAARPMASFHAFKWRIAMAIATAGNVAVVDILRAFDEVVPDRAALAAHTGWSPEVIATIDAYRTSNVEYSFPTADETIAAFAPRFAIRAIHTPTYELGDRCPTIVLRAIAETRG